MGPINCAPNRYAVNRLPVNSAVYLFVSEAHPSSALWHFENDQLQNLNSERRRQLKFEVMFICKLGSKVTNTPKE